MCRDGGDVPIYNGSGSCLDGERIIGESCDTEGWPVSRETLEIPVAVYNFQTTTGNYLASGVLVHNCDLHARHLWLVNRREDITDRLMADPDWYDAKIAGWWVWGLCSWIGSGWCSGQGPWQARDGKLVDTRKLPHLGDAGMGINRQLPHLGDAGMGINRKRQHLRATFSALADRLRAVRVCCGDWSRVTGDSVTIKHAGITGVFLDPPYADTAGRDSDLYACDDEQVAHRVREWAIDHGDDPRLRIALCGYAGEHAMPDHWTAHTWKAKGGYGSQGDGAGRINAAREVIWFSPHCLTAKRQADLFAAA